VTTALRHWLAVAALAFVLLGASELTSHVLLPLARRALRRLWHGPRVQVASGMARVVQLGGGQFTLEPPPHIRVPSGYGLKWAVFQRHDGTLHGHYEVRPAPGLGMLWRRWRYPSLIDQRPQLPVGKVRVRVR
jgi:hypothetical protein